MSLINIGGTTHVTRSAGETLCGERYPKTWPGKLRGPVHCPGCQRVLDAEQEAMYAKFRKPMEPAPDIADIPW